VKPLQLSIHFDREVSRQVPGLSVCLGTVKAVHIEKENEEIRSLRKEAYSEVRRTYLLETLKDNQTVRAYRDLYWRLDIDPTKTRPSGEALLRRVLHGSSLPNISTVVDAYNLTSMKTIVPISGFDLDLLNPPFHVRFAENKETFSGIGMEEPTVLTKRMLVFADQKQILCIYPYRDSDKTKITEQTKNVLIVGYGALGIGEQQLKNAVESTLSYIKQVAGGETGTAMVFSEQACLE
jgi:DNA/RNA-binding domain of Phe-tRNA-synthetase-like protein